MADPTKVIKGGLSAVRNASRAADQALEAKRLALEAANPPIKASEAYGQHEGAYMKPIFYDRMKVDLSKGKKGGPGFSGIQLVDPNYADAKAVAGVTDQKMATRILNRNKAGVPAGAKVIWTPSVGSLEQHKSNSTMFGEFADIFANQRKNMSAEEIQKLSDRASNAVNNKGELIFPNGIDLGSRNFRQKVTTYDQRGLMADIFAGRGVGGEKGRTVPVEELLEKNLDPNVAGAGTLDLGNRLFRLEGNVIDRPDLHSDYRKILTGEDLNVNYIPVPIRDVYSDWEAQKALDLIAQGKNRGVTLMDYTKNDPTVQLTEELLTKMQKAGHKKGGVVERKETPEEMARFHERFALHKATGGKVDIPHLSLKKAKGGGVHMVDGGKIAKGLMGAVEKASKAADAAMAAKKVEAPTIIIPSKLDEFKKIVQQEKGGYGARRLERAADEIPNLEKLYKEQALREAFLGDNAKALMTMNPADFEKYAAKLFTLEPSQGALPQGSSDDYLNYLRKLEGFRDVPFLEINKREQGTPVVPYISGHEGRHRSRAMTKNDETSSLVRLLPRSEMREPFPRRSQEEYIEALKEELALTGNKVKPENYTNLDSIKVITRPPIDLPDIYAEGGGVHMVDGGKIAKGITGALTKASKMADEKLAADAIGKAAESAGMKAPVTANKPLTTVQDFHTSFGDSVRKRAADMQATMDSLDYKYDKGQRVFTEDSAKKNWPPMTVLGRVLEGNRIMREDPTDFLSKKIIDEATGKAKRTPHEPGYKVRLEHAPDNWSEFVIPESAIKGSVDFARGGLAMAGGGNVLKGNILAGASWNSLNKTLGDELTKATGQSTLNTAVGGATTADTYKQLMDFINGGGSFDPNATVFLQTGGVDFITGVPREEVKNNIEQIISVLDQQGVNVVLTGAPYAASMDDVINNKFDPHIDPIFEEIAAAHPNVALVDSMGDILQDKSLLSDSLHTNETGTRRYNDDVIGALTTLQQRQEQTQGDREAETIIPQEVERITQPAIEQETVQQVADPVKQDFQESITQTEPPRAVETETPTDTEKTVAPSVPDYSRAYEALGGADVVNGLRDQLLGMGIDESTIADAFAKYYPNEYQPEFAQEQLKRGGAVRKETPEEMARFQKRFALHKATGGKINIPHLSLKKPKKFDGGGIAAVDVGEGVEDKGITKAGLMTEFLAKAAKEQGKEELSSLNKPRAATDLLNRGVLANNPLSAMVDLVNMGLVPLDVLGSKLTGRDIKVSSDKPFLGSEYVKDLMNQYGVTSGEERPMMETALSFASPTAMIKGAMKATDTAKKAPELMKKASDAFTSSKMSPLATEAKTATAGKPTGATYATKQEGPFFRVSPTALDTSKAKTRGVREADELQGQAPLGGGAGSTGSQVPTRLADEEVARIIADPVANEPLNIAKKYTQETQGADFVLPDIPESSLVKQSAIGRAQQLAVEGSPEYKTAVFDAYAREMPDVLEKAGAKNYDDLMEKAYRQMAKETDDQFKALPYNFSYHRAGEGNYNSSKEMAADVHGNKHLYVYQGGDKHDFLNRIDPASGLNENEKFRAVHDLLGHAIYGNQFGPKGEEMAWAIHSQMYSPLARLAMTAETRGQNSMVNYSPLNANLKAELAKYDSMANEARRKGDKALLNEINAAKRQAYAGFEFAPNKAVLLPPEFLSPKYAGGMPAYLEAANRPVKGTETQSVLTHFSNDPNLTLLDPKRYGTGIKGAEAERLRDYAGGVKDRSYFYLGEPGAVAPEAGLGVNRYRGEASSLYDITQDPLNFQRLARESNRTPFTAKYNQGMTYPLQDANDVERLVKEYGYQGMANPKATKPMAIMFKETPVRRQARGGLTLMK